MNSKANLLRLLKAKLNEVKDFIVALKYYPRFKLDINDAETEQIALNIAVVVSYARNFKKCEGFTYNVEEMNNKLKKDFTDEENKLHQRIISDRDKIITHLDDSAYDVQNNIEDFEFSIRREPQLLEKGELLMLQVMVSKIRVEIDKQIIDLK